MDATGRQNAASLAAFLKFSSGGSVHVLVTADSLSGSWTYARELVTGLVTRGVRVTLVSFGEIPLPEQTSWMDHLHGLDYRPTTYHLESMQAAEEDLPETSAFLSALVRELRPDILLNLREDDFASDQADLAAISHQPQSAIDESLGQPTLTGIHGTGAVRIKDATPRTTFRPKPYHIVAFPTRQQMNTISPFFSDEDFAGDQADLATMSQQPQSALDESLVLPTFNDEDLAGDQANLAAPQPPWWRRGRGTIMIIAVILLFVILGGIDLAIRLTRRPTRVYHTANVHH